MNIYNAGKVGPAERARLAAGTGAIIRAARTALGWSMSELARRANTQASTVSAYEAGRTRPSLTMLGRFAAAFQPVNADEARRLLRRMAEAAGASLNTPMVAKTVARESVTTVLVRALELLGLDPDDDRVRGAVRQAIADLDQQDAAEDGGAVPAITATAETAVSDQCPTPSKPQVTGAEAVCLSAELEALEGA